MVDGDPGILESIETTFCRIPSEKSLVQPRVNIRKDRLESDALGDDVGVSVNVLRSCSSS